jgi:hypothetical protein
MLVGEKSRRGRIPFGFEFVTNSVLESLRSVPLGHDVSDAAGPELGHTKIEKWEGEKERLAGLGLASSWVSAHCQIGIRKSFSFSNLFIICKLI